MTEAEDPARSLLLLDTHVLVWLVGGINLLGAKTRSVLQKAADQGTVLVSAITPWEIALLVSKNRLKLNQDVMPWLQRALVQSEATIAPLELEIAVASTRLPFEMHADPADRILVATARHLGATLVTADRALLDLAASGGFRAIDASR